MSFVTTHSSGRLDCCFHRIPEKESPTAQHCRHALIDSLRVDYADMGAVL